MEGFKIDRRRAVSIYNTMIEPIAVGADGEGYPVHRATPASAMAEVIGLPFCLSDSPADHQAECRTKAAIFFRLLADALDPGVPNAG